MTLPLKMSGKGGCPGLGFSYHEKPVANYYILDRFRYGLENAGYRLGETSFDLPPPPPHLQYSNAYIVIGTDFAGVCMPPFRSHDGSLR
jgi:hypothetical protein